MPEHARKPRFPNPFYLVLVLASTAFAVTALAYLMSSYVERRPAAGAGNSQALAAWFDRNGPFALGVEFLVMLVFAILAMATDHWFPSKPARNEPPPSS